MTPPFLPNDPLIEAVTAMFDGLAADMERTAAKIREDANEFREHPERFDPLRDNARHSLRVVEDQD